MGKATRRLTLNYRSSGVLYARRLPIPVIVSLGGIFVVMVGCSTPPRGTSVAPSPVAPPAVAPQSVNSPAVPPPFVAPPVVAPSAVSPQSATPPAQQPVGITANLQPPPAVTMPLNVGDPMQPRGPTSPVWLATYDAKPDKPAEPAVENVPAPLSPSPTGEAMPIDLPTALRLVDANSPTVAFARDRVREAYLQERQADLAWLPDLRTGPTYDRHDGRDQNSNGTIFEVSKQSLFVGGGAILDWNTSELLFGRLAAQRLTEAAQANARAVTSNVQLDVALAYLDLLQAYGEFAIFADAARSG